MSFVWPREIMQRISEYDGTYVCRTINHAWFEASKLLPYGNKKINILAATAYQHWIINLSRIPFVSQTIKSDETTNCVITRHPMFSSVSHQWALNALKSFCNVTVLKINLPASRLTSIRTLVEAVIAHPTPLSVFCLSCY